MRGFLLILVMSVVHAGIAEDPVEEDLLPPPCECEFEDLGEPFKMQSPESSCADGVKQVLKCDGEIYSKAGNTLVGYDNLFCEAGEWYGKTSAGKVSVLNVLAAKVQCSNTTEPPFCRALPKRGGLKYVETTFDGWQRYKCSGNRVVRVQYKRDGITTTNHGKYVDCATQLSRTLATVASDYFPNYAVITDVSCRDYGTFNEACTVPASRNAWLKDGVMECEKGHHFDRIGIVRVGDTREVVTYESAKISTARCGSNGWSIPGTSYSGLRLSYFWCNPDRI